MLKQITLMKESKMIVFTNLSPLEKILILLLSSRYMYNSKTARSNDYKILYKTQPSTEIVEKFVIICHVNLYVVYIVLCNHVTY
jgi:hypothetical protein